MWLRATFNATGKTLNATRCDSGLCAVQSFLIELILQFSVSWCLEEKRTCVRLLWESAEWDMSGFYDDDSQPLLLWLAQIKSGSDSRRQLAEQEGTNRWDWTTDENEQTMKMNKQWRCCYDFWEGRVGAALRSCSIRLATQLLGMRWIRFARKDKQIVQKKVDWFSQVLVDASSVSPRPGWW